ncbi:MAG: EF-P lysine aminoacylase GenX [Desulfobacterales bacterium]|nr:EF-P lysine aminoacylase GenX [Desulfobacterales bacterium]
MNPTASLEKLRLRSRLIQGVRTFFHDRGYLEVEPPVLGPEIIPEAYIDPITSGDSFLPASPEIYMKRLLARGHTRLFQICKCFRRDEHGDRHLSEFTMLEWYGAHQTYLDLMAQCQDLFRHLAQVLDMGTTLHYQGKTIDLSGPFERLTVAQAFEQYSTMDCWQALDQGKFDEIISFDIEPALGMNRPLILQDYPSPLASLAELLPGDPTLAQRFELYASGMELANGFTELTDPIIQRQRFEEENAIRVQRGQSPLPLPEQFLSDLEKLPPAAGIALGLDRLIMLFTNEKSIHNIVSFSHNP